VYLIFQATSQVVCDDDKLSVKKEDDIKALYGGGDFHMAYLCMYKARYI